MAPIASVNADLTIGVSLSGTDTDLRAEDSAGSETTATRERLNRLLRSTSALLENQTARSVLGRLGAVAETPSGTEDYDVEAYNAGEAPLPKLGSFAVMNRTIEISQAALARHQLAAYPPDLLIVVPRAA